MPRCSPTAACMWSRWDHAPGKDAMHFYSANPDGTDLQLYYGANSHNTGTNNTVVEFVHPRQMEDGRILALARQYTDVDDGGALLIIDGEHYVENTQALLGNPGLAGPAQTPATQSDVVTIPGPSPGRALLLRLSAAGRHRPRPRQLDVSAGCSTAPRHRRRSCRAIRPRSTRRTPWWRRRSTACGCTTRRRTRCCRSCSRSRAC